MSIHTLIEKKSIVYVGVGCAYSRTWGENREQYVHQQYPKWLSELDCPKLLILIDPFLEEPPNIVSELGIYEEVIRVDEETKIYIMSKDLTIVSIRSGQTFKSKPWENGEETLEPYTVAFYKGILDKVLETHSILINAFYSGAREELLKSQFPNVPLNQVIWNLGYGADYSCYPPVNSLTTPIIETTEVGPRITNPYCIPLDKVYSTWKETTYKIYREQLAYRIICHIEFVKKYSAFVDFVMRRHGEGIRLEPDQWYLCNLEQTQLNQIRINYESGDKMDFDYAIQLIGQIYTDNYLNIFRYLPDLDQTLISFVANKRYENVSKIYRCAKDILSFSIATN